jgi:regulator of ribonuclease activity A
MPRSTCDICDDFPEDVNVLDPLFRDFGARAAFAGRIVTIKCHEDNSRVRDLVAEDGRGAVLVVDGGGSMRRALLGDQLAAKAVANGWEGIVIFGAVRDVEALREMDIGVKALGAIPIKTDKKGLGERDVALRFAGVDILPGHFLYADGNGIVVSARELSAGA